MATWSTRPDASTSYQYDPLYRLEQVKQSGDGAVDKRADFAYNPVGQFTSITRYADDGSTLVATSDYAYDGIGYLTGLTHTYGTTDIDYTWTYDAVNAHLKMTH